MMLFELQSVMMDSAHRHTHTQSIKVHTRRLIKMRSF